MRYSQYVTYAWRCNAHKPKASHVFGRLSIFRNWQRDTSAVLSEEYTHFSMTDENLPI